MGNWNRRYVTRKKYIYQEAPASPPTESDLYGISKNNVPSWEKNFCVSVGIQWQKVIVAKRYMYCHDNVVKWNDSAGEEAFNNAKKRFWAKINGLPCHNPLPDPEMYIDEIDWYPDIDHELILDLDREYFNPDEAEKVDNAEVMNQTVHKSVLGHTLGWDDKNPGNGGNPWECNHEQGTQALNDEAQGWNQSDNSVNLQNVNDPWKYNYSHGEEALKDGKSRGGDRSCGWDQWPNFTRQSKNLSNNGDNPWECGFQDARSMMKENGFQGVANNSWGGSCWEASIYESRNLDNGVRHWGNNFIQGSVGAKNRGWRDCGDIYSGGWKQWESRNNGLKHLDLRRPSSGDGRALNGGCRKREGSQQQMSRYKSARFQGDAYGIGYHWRKEDL